MSDRNRSGKQQAAILAGVLLALTFAVSLAGFSRIPAAPQAITGQVLALENGTGSSVAGIQIVFDAGIAPSKTLITFSSAKHVGPTLLCGTCIWVRADVADGGVLRLTLQADMAEAFENAYWYATPKAYLNAMRRSVNCSVL